MAAVICSAPALAPRLDASRARAVRARVASPLTARGGVAVAVEQDLEVPVKFIGVGEGMDDLIPFEPRQYVEALLEP